jgi:hypothetical protein
MYAEMIRHVGMPALATRHGHAIRGHHDGGWLRTHQSLSNKMQPVNFMASKQTNNFNLHTRISSGISGI